MWRKGFSLGFEVEQQSWWRKEANMCRLGVPEGGHFEQKRSKCGPVAWRKWQVTQLVT